MGCQSQSALDTISGLPKPEPLFRAVAQSLSWCFRQDGRLTSRANVHRQGCIECGAPPSACTPLGPILPQHCCELRKNLRYKADHSSWQICTSSAQSSPVQLCLLVAGATSADVALVLVLKGVFIRCAEDLARCDINSGLLVLFPSWSPHLVLPHPSHKFGSSPRISISFNVYIQ